MPVIERLEVGVYTVPTDGPEEDGTLRWDSTTAIVIRPAAGGVVGLGYGYGDPAAGEVVRNLLADVVLGSDALAVPSTWEVMVRRVRNAGRHGIAAAAISAVDNALWDLKARLLGLPLCDLLGRVRDAVPAYGSGGFVNYSVVRMQEQLSGWAADGFDAVKMKIGSRPWEDAARVGAAREAIGPATGLFVDANGAYGRKQALQMAETFATQGVTWFEEPVSSDDLSGLRLLRDRAPAGIAVAAGEYGYDSVYFRRMLAAGAVDVLQADATRCCGITGFLQAAAVARAFAVPLSAHTAPSLHLHLGCALADLLHVEYFFDHARLEPMLFDGAAQPVDGHLRPQEGRQGLGLELRGEAARFAA